MSAGYDVFKYADAWSSEWEYCIQCRYLSVKDVVDLFKKKLITVDEYIYAVDYLGG